MTDRGCWRLFFGLMTMLGVATDAPGQQATSSLEDRLRNEGMAAWSKREKLADDIEIEGSLTENMNSLAPQPIRFAQLDGKFFLETAQDAKNLGSVLCVSDANAFVLARKQAGSPYAISYMGTNDRANVINRLNRKFPVQLKHLIQKPFGFELTNLLRPPTSGQRSPLKVESIIQDGRELARVTYVTTGDRSPTTKQPEETMTELVFDPGHQWVPLRGTFYRASRNNTAMTFEYGADEAEVPTLTKYRWEQEIPNKDGTAGKVFQNWEFAKFSRQSLSPKLFTMANFGVTELDSPLGLGGGPRYEIWLLGLAGAFAAFAVAVRVRGSRRSVA